MVVIAIVGLLSAIAIPNFVKSRDAARRNACIKNLKTIDEAKHLWGIENAKNESALPGDADLVGMDKYIKAKPICPATGTCAYLTIGDQATCTIEGHSY